jgi:hypothetical protein
MEESSPQSSNKRQGNSLSSSSKMNKTPRTPSSMHLNCYPLIFWPTIEKTERKSQEERLELRFNKEERGSIAEAEVVEEDMIETVEETEETIEETIEEMLEETIEETTEEVIEEIAEVDNLIDQVDVSIAEKRATRSLSVLNNKDTEEITVEIEMEIDVN